MIEMEIEKVENLISAVRSIEKMNPDDLSEFIESVANRDLPIKLIEKWLKAVHSKGITVEQTTLLTKGMMQSGAILEWDDNTLVVDKHSTGGVGDKMSIILAPALAACGVKVPMLAGRGLGHTGGTIDKLEAIPGFNCSLTPEEMQRQVLKIGCCIAAQNDAIAPADGLLYAIRDVTNTIDSIPLITASIISKKAAEGLGSLVLDVKCGAGAFMKTRKDAEDLARSMVGAANGLGINTTAQITQMDFPIGKYIGNSLEILGSIEVLQGKGSKDTREIVVLQGSALLLQSGVVKDIASGANMMNKVLDDESALGFFEKMCLEQSVNKEVVKELIQEPRSILPNSKSITSALAKTTGYVTNIDSMSLAELARRHGAGRFTIDDEIIPEIGFEILINYGVHIAKGDAWINFHHNEPLSSSQIEALESALMIESEKPMENSRLITTIS